MSAVAGSGSVLLRPISTDLKAVADSLTIRDVTDDNELFSEACNLIVEGYIGLSSNRLDPLQIRESICFDRYHRLGLARTLLVTGCNPNSGVVESLGTVRLTLPSRTVERNGLNQIEAMDLMTPLVGWPNFTFRAFDLGHLVEGGRTAVSRACRMGAAKELGVSRVVLATLLREGFQLAAKRYGKTQLWGVLPSYFAGTLSAIGCEVHRAPGISLNVEKSGLFQKYDRYWLQGNPGFYRVIVPSLAPQQLRDNEKGH